jgi:DNA-binding CsgD family transcriptional regulator
VAEGLEPGRKGTGHRLSDAERDLRDAERDQVFESLPEREKGLLRLVADGLSDAEIADGMGEPAQVIALEIQGVLTELGFRSRTHAIVYVLAREISTTSRDQKPRAPIAHELPEEEEESESGGTEEAGSL